MVGTLCTRDFSFGAFCAGDWVGVTSISLRGLVTGCFLQVCGVESLWRDWLGMKLLLWEQCLDGVLPGEAGNWRSDLDLRCRLCPLSQGMAPYTILWRLLTGSLDVFLSGGAVTLMAGSPILSTLGGIGDGSYLLQMPFLDFPHSFIYGAVLLLDESLEPDLLPVTGDHKGSVSLPRHLHVCAFFDHFAEALSVSNVTFFELRASRPSRHYRSAEVVIAVMIPTARSSSIVYILRRVAVSQQKGMVYPPMWALCCQACAIHSSFFMTSSWICARFPGLGLPMARFTSLALSYTSERKLPMWHIWLWGSP